MKINTAINIVDQFSVKKLLLFLFFLLSLGLTSVSSGKTILSDEANEMLDDHVKQSELLKAIL